MKLAPKLSVLFLLSLLFTVALHAQQAADVRVSPPDSDSYAIPPEGQIQSSARIGEVSLVAWGTTVNDDVNGLTIVLRFQVLHGSQPAGAQAVVHSRTARPFHFVKVIAAVGCFVVVWEDGREGASGLYGRRIALDGTFLGDEEWLGPVHVFSYYESAVGDGAMELLGDPFLGQTLLWVDGRSNTIGVYALHVDSDGKIRGPEVYLGHGLRSLTNYPRIGNVWILTADSASARLIHSDGHIDDRTIPPEHLDVPYFVDVDTSLITVSGGVVRFYPSIFATQSAKIVRVEALDSAFGGTILAARDSAGKLQVFFGVVNVASTWRVTFYRVEIDGDTVSAPEPVFDTGGDNSTQRDPATIYTLDDVRGSNGCANTRRVVVEFSSILYYHGSAGNDVSIVHFQFSVDTVGRFAFDGVEIVPDHPFAGPTGFISDCLQSPDTTLRRISSDSLSTVRDLIDGVPVELTTVTGSWKTKLPQTNPSLALYGGDLVVSWIHQGSQFALARWDRVDSSASIIERRSVPAPGIPVGVPYNPWNPVIEHTSFVFSDTVLAWPGAMALSANVTRTDIAYYEPVPGRKEVAEYVQANGAIYLASSHGWNGVFDRTGLQASGTPPPGISYGSVSVELLGWDPNRNELLVRELVTSSRMDSLTAYTQDGTVSWQAPRPNFDARYLPVGPSEFLAIAGNRFRHYCGDTIADSGNLTPSPGAASYIGALGRRFLRMTTSDPTRISLMCFSLSGLPEDSVTIDSPAPITAATICQDRRDSSFALVYVSDGIRVARLTQHLVPEFRDSLISSVRTGVSHPSAALRNDTLFVVWEDHRSGEPDIYGNYLSLPAYHDPVQDTVEQHPTDSSAGSTQPAIPSTGIDRVYPNPARGLLHVECRLAGSGTIEVVDPIGRVVRREMIGSASSGMRPIDLAVDDLIEGVYLLRLRSGAAVSTAGFVVMR